MRGLMVVLTRASSVPVPITSATTGPVASLCVTTGIGANFMR